MLSNKEIGRLQIGEFNHMYQLYKNNFDLELVLIKSGTTYEELKNRQMQAEEWF